MTSQKTALIVGASRGLGYAIVQNLLERQWHVIGTIRSESTSLANLNQSYSALEIETLDITSQEQIDALRKRLADRQLDLLFVNSGTTNEDPSNTLNEVATEEFIRVYVTNTLSPMRVVETFAPLVVDDGVIGVMSSGQGSVTNNTMGNRDVYRGSKAALNTSMRCFAARNENRAMVLMAPGHIKTDLGGKSAPYTIEETIPGIVDVIIGHSGQKGLQYLDRLGQTVPW